MNHHSGTKAAITGGTQGLGFAIAKRLIEEGARSVAICGRNREKGEAAATLLRNDTDAKVVFVQTDLSNPDAAVGFITKAIETFGGLNALVNSAGLTTRGGLLDTDLATWEAHMAVNLRAPFLTMQTAVRYMKATGIPGSIVNIISMTALCGQSYLTPYSVAKGGLSTLTKNVANAFAADRIRCNGVLAGWMETPGEALTQKMFHGAGDDWAERAGKTLPMGKLVQPDELAGLVAYMLSPESGVMTGALVEYDQVVSGAYPE